MNTNFHMNGIQHAYSSLALTSSDTNLKLRIGKQSLEFPMVSLSALMAAMRQLREKVIISFDDAKTICADCNQETIHDSYNHDRHFLEKPSHSQARV
jgi:hypothetical protein